VTKTGRVRLPDGRIECVSCHDPHNTAGIDKLLVMSNRRSALCLTCHIK
jgi:predicted CXXCH cytochrome family protein